VTAKAVLLGSSQMREAFVMPLAALALYGLARAWDIRTWRALGGVLGPLILLVPISPPFAGILIALLGVVGLGLDGWRVVRSWRLWGTLAGLGLLAAAALWLGWDRIASTLAGRPYDTPLAMFAHWFELVGRWQAYQTVRASGWVQKITRETPAWFDTPFLMSYGISRPLLPAALIASSNRLWQFIGVWRSLGWTLLLPLLAYAPIRAALSGKLHGPALPEMMAALGKERALQRVAAAI